MRDGNNPRFVHEEQRAEGFIRGVLTGQDPMRPPDDVALISWPDFEGDLGYRVAELTVTYGMGGWSAMQVDHGSSQVIVFAAERLVLAYHNEGKDGWPEDDVEAAEWHMREALKP